MRRGQLLIVVIMPRTNGRSARRAQAGIEKVFRQSEAFSWSCQQWIPWLRVHGERRQQTGRRGQPKKTVCVGVVRYLVTAAVQCLEELHDAYTSVANPLPERLAWLDAHLGRLPPLCDALEGPLGHVLKASPAEWHRRRRAAAEELVAAMLGVNVYTLRRWARDRAMRARSERIGWRPWATVPVVPVPDDPRSPQPAAT